MKKAIFLDRDGTIIVDKVYLNDPSGIEYLPNAFEGLRLFRDLGYLLIVATNQSGIARGIIEIQNLHKIHARIRSELAAEGIDIAGFYYAPYAPEANHPARKPGPGMLQTAARDFGLELSRCWMIGDHMTDVEAGWNAGTRSVLLPLSNGKFETAEGKREPEISAANLLSAAKEIKNFKIRTP